MSKIEICRICLQTIPTKCFSLFDNYKDNVITEHIKSVAAVEIDADDELPQGICPDCLLQLDNALEFKGKCERSDKILRNGAQERKLNTSDKVSIEAKLEISVKNPVETIKEESESMKEENGSISDDNVTEHTEYLDIDDVPETNEVVERKSRAIDLKLICDDCGGSFKSKCKLKVHWKKVHFPDTLVCNFCKRVFKSNHALQMHLKMRPQSCFIASKVKIEGLGKNRIFHCTYCSYNSKSVENLGAHLATHTGERRFTCNICGKSYTQHGSLTSHKESAHKDIKYHITCHICGKQFSGRSNCDKHLRTHRMSKNVQCTVCNKVFKSRQCFNVHMERHSGVKAHTCEICGKDFYTSSDLIIHRKKTHLKEDKYFKHKCKLCEFKSPYKNILSKHLSKHTNTNIPCLRCGHFFDDAEKYAKHKKRHEEPRYPCPLCDKKYATSKSRSLHVREKHKCTVRQNKEAISVTDLKQESIEQE